MPLQLAQVRNVLSLSGPCWACSDDIHDQVQTGLVCVKHDSVVAGCSVPNGGEHGLNINLI